MQREINSLDELDYVLPERLIAQEPAEERTMSRLLAVTPNGIEDRVFRDLGDFSRRNDLLVLNDTRVIPGRIPAMKESGGAAEMLVERVLGEQRALVQIGASRSPGAGSILRLQPGSAKARVVARKGEFFEVEFEDRLSQVLATLGETPLPPYVRRRPEAADEARYQTVYAERDGAVAAPTAGLHFDQLMLDELQDKGVNLARLTLHIGAGTFSPLREDILARNTLHSEWMSVSGETMRAVRETREMGGRVIAVGTTVTRALETAFAKGDDQGYEGETDLFIQPGFKFQAVDILLTNFHLPRSSLLALVYAFGGVSRIRAAYRHAIDREYRFYSYGDAMLILNSS